MPQSDSELLTVKGIGEHKLVKYGSHFLQAVQHFIEENPNYAETIKTEVVTERKKSGKFQQILIWKRMKCINKVLI